MFSLPFRVLAFGVLITLFQLNSTMGIAALATVFGYVLAQRTLKRDS